MFLCVCVCVCVCVCTQGIKRFEGSSITYCNKTGYYYVVYDSLRAIGRVGIGVRVCVCVSVCPAPQ